MNRYPLGIQTFEEIRKNNQYYVDKTDLIYNIAKGSQSNFLNRPRRFGKSLLVTTMQAYFEGKKDLFKGLAIEKLEKEWVKYPVIHLDLSRGKYYEIQVVHSTLNAVLGFYEAKLGITVAEGTTYGTRLDEIIQTTAAQTGQKVVVLIDEYDAPMLDSNAKPELQEQIRSIMYHARLLQSLKGQRGTVALCLPHRHHEVLAAQHLQRTEQHQELQS